MQYKENLLNIIIKDLIRYKNKADYLIYVAQLSKESWSEECLLDLKDYLVSRTVLDKEFTALHKPLLRELDFFLYHKSINFKISTSYGFVDFYEVYAPYKLVDWLVTHSADLKMSPDDAWLLSYRARYGYSLCVTYITTQGFVEGSSVKIILIVTDFEPFNQALLEHCMNGYLLQNKQLQSIWRNDND